VQTPTQAVPHTIHTIVAVRRDIVEDPYSDLAKVITDYALAEAKKSVREPENCTWNLIDWTGPFSVDVNDAPSNVIYFRAIVERSYKPGVREAQMEAEQPLGRIYVPISKALAEDSSWDLGGFIREAATEAARVAWEDSGRTAKGYTIKDWAGPYDFMYGPGDLPLHTCCYQVYVEVER
jgi:hypothetical protein